METFLVGLKFLAGLQLVSLMVTGAGGLRDVHIHVPQAVLTGSSATLLCRYDLEGDALYTVKWYKGRDEFFRYVPKEHPHTRVFPLPGVIVDIDASGRDRVTLMAVDRTLTSKYRCEVSTDAPDFHTEVVSAHLQVLDPPVGLPQVEVEKTSYAVGDTLRANCSAPWAAFNLNLTWLINGRKVNESEYVDLTEAEAANVTTMLPHTEVNESEYVDLTEAEAANVTTMSLHTEVCKGGRLRLQCVASLYDVYSTVAEIWLDEDRPRLASVLGTRESSADSRGCTKGTVMWTLSAAIASLVVVS